MARLQGCCAAAHAGHIPASAACAELRLCAVLCCAVLCCAGGSNSLSLRWNRSALIKGSLKSDAQEVFHVTLQPDGHSCTPGQQPDGHSCTADQQPLLLTPACLPRRQHTWGHVSAMCHARSQPGHVQCMLRLAVAAAVATALLQLQGAAWTCTHVCAGGCAFAAAFSDAFQSSAQSGHAAAPRPSHKYVIFHQMMSS
jgi:hypothetical protein